MTPFLSHIDGGLWVCVCGHVREWHAGGECFFGSLGQGFCKCEAYRETEESPDLSTDKSMTKEEDMKRDEGELRRLAEAVVEQVHGKPWGREYGDEPGGSNISGTIHSHTKKGTDALVALRSYLALSAAERNER